MQIFINLFYSNYLILYFAISGRRIQYEKEWAVFQIIVLITAHSILDTAAYWLPIITFIPEFGLLNRSYCISYPCGQMFDEFQRSNRRNAASTALL